MARQVMKKTGEPRPVTDDDDEEARDGVVAEVSVTPRQHAKVRGLFSRPAGACRAYEEALLFFIC